MNDTKSEIPAPPPTTEAAQAAAREIACKVDIYSAVEWDSEMISKVAAIISKHLPAAGEVEAKPDPSDYYEREVTVMKDGVYKSEPRRTFADLRAKMSPEAQARAAMRTQEMLSELDPKDAEPKPMVCRNAWHQNAQTSGCPDCGMTIAELMPAH